MFSSTSWDKFKSRCSNNRIFSQHDMSLFLCVYLFFSIAAEIKITEQHLALKVGTSKFISQYFDVLWEDQLFWRR